MLVLSRKENEAVIVTVGEVEIEVCVVVGNGRNVRLGFQAPPDVSIRRKELVLETLHRGGDEGKDRRVA